MLIKICPNFPWVLKKTKQGENNKNNRIMKQKKKRKKQY